MRQWVQITELKAEALENRALRENIRVRGLKGDVEGTDLRATMKEFFASLLAGDHPNSQVDRAHRVGPRREGGAHGPRDILVKMQGSEIKDEILLAARRRDEVTYKGYPCALYQDLAPATLMKRN